MDGPQALLSPSYKKHLPPPSIEIPERKSSLNFAERVKGGSKGLSARLAKEVRAVDEDASTIVGSESLQLPVCYAELIPLEYDPRSFESYSSSKSSVLSQERNSSSVAHRRSKNSLISRKLDGRSSISNGSSKPSLTSHQANSILEDDSREADDSVSEISAFAEDQRRLHKLKRSISSLGAKVAKLAANEKLMSKSTEFLQQFVDTSEEKTPTPFALQRPLHPSESFSLSVKSTVGSSDKPSQEECSDSRPVSLVSDSTSDSFASSSPLWRDHVDFRASYASLAIDKLSVISSIPSEEKRAAKRGYPSPPRMWSAAGSPPTTSKKTNRSTESTPSSTPADEAVGLGIRKNTAKASTTPAAFSVAAPKAKGNNRNSILSGRRTEVLGGSLADLEEIETALSEALQYSEKLMVLKDSNDLIVSNLEKELFKRMATAEELLSKNAVGPLDVSLDVSADHQIPVTVKELSEKQKSSPAMKPKKLQETEKEEAIKQIRHQKSLGERRWEKARKEGAAAMFLAGSP